jgi:hypothetical protein
MLCRLSRNQTEHWQEFFKGTIIRYLSQSQIVSESQIGTYVQLTGNKNLKGEIKI